ncbi:MAG: hypothetical protein HRT61_19355 [Ekhidna sp.]|nr:hypothetical protein [Ekhidna sp.]
MKRLVVGSFLFLFFGASFAQRVVQIEFDGLKKTKPEYLYQFVDLQVGDALDSAVLYANKQRLANLEMFSDVNFLVERTNEGYRITFAFTELYTFLPIFSFGGIEENFWVQVGATEVNLGGRGNKLTTYYQYYDRSSFAAHLTLNRIKQRPWGANFNLIKWSTLEPLFFADEVVQYPILP